MSSFLIFLRRSVALQVTGEVGQGVDRHADGILGFSRQREAFSG
jgi:hypothetical protein